MTIQEYIDSVSRRYASGITTEHSFRGDLQSLLESLLPDVTATNEPKRIDCGAPDYVLTKKAIPVGYVEAKDVGKDLDSADLKEQFDRYRAALGNLAITDYLQFRFYVNGEIAGPPVRIAEIVNGRVMPLAANYEHFEARIREFAGRTTQTIKGSQRLAEMMADKAKILAYTIQSALDSDERTEENTTLREQLAAFKQILIHDIDSKQFSDIYAQTIAYGMFAARLHDRDLDTFSRQEAAELIPKTNPFLRKLFQYIAGYDLDTRIDWIVDDLADLFRATDIAAILKNFGKTRRSEDPIIHFYETFLAEYDPKLRKARGVYYTPEPVVDFIVRAVDDILKTEFGLAAGLADTSKVKVKVKTPVVRKKSEGTVYEDIEKEFHRVQILDPAAGTGTFLAQVIRQIYKRFENQQGAWPTYVENDLIPRLNGFELLMASYAMAHLKLDLLLSELSEEAASPPYLRSSSAAPAVSPPDRGSAAADAEAQPQEVFGEPPVKQSFTANRAAEPQGGRTQRFQIYLTNSLEEYHPDTGTLWASWLSTEANEANHIKRDTPVMVVIGNPPYSGESKNKGDWIMSLMEDYKKEPGGKEKLKERNPKWINDDYVKFIRLGQQLIEKNGEGLLAFINPHGFLDNPTFRGMRWNLLKTYDKIYVLDLHGNTTKQETCPDGSPDINVFDIMQGVSINLLIKNGKKKEDELGQVFHFDLYGKRGDKYSFLLKNDISSVPYTLLTPREPRYYMIPFDIAAQGHYEEGIQLSELFGNNNMGITSGNDDTRVGFQHETLVSNFDDSSNICPISYRPFDCRYIYYDPKILARARFDFMTNLNGRNNLALTAIGQSRVGNVLTPVVASGLIDKSIVSSVDNAFIFPLYVYPDSTQPTLDGRPERVPNLNMEIVDKIAGGLGMEFVAERTGEQASRLQTPLAASSRGGGETGGAGEAPALQAFAPIDLLDYIYAVLHSPAYRERYKEFLKIDFPRVPYPTERETFWRLVGLGGELRQLHLLESSRVEEFITGFPVGGSNEVVKPVFAAGPLIAGGTPALQSTGDVFINDTQFFSGVPHVAWDFYIGGYQPAQKWLKDRKGRTLSYEDIQHYQKMIVALTETARVMAEIDEIAIVRKAA